MEPKGYSTKEKVHAYLTPIGAWALAFGCAVGWGSFVMPGSTFLPIGGPLGTVIGILIGAVVMLILGVNYHYMMNTYPDAGGTYSYTKYCFGYDQGFLNAWFLILIYIAIIWANATALPLIARNLIGGVFQFGFHYQIAGFDVYLGEVLLAIVALAIGAAVCLRRKLSERTQIVTAVLLFAGILICFIAVMANRNGTVSVMEPPFSPDKGAGSGIFTIFALTPWAFVGFESISHSAAEAKFSLKKSFRIMAIAVGAAAAAYILLTLIAAAIQPDGVNGWVDYIMNLGEYSGKESVPVFYAIRTALGPTGSMIVGIAALCGIFTGLVGNYIALSRLLFIMSEDSMLPAWFRQVTPHFVPKNAILFIMGISMILPFLGRTAISWIVDVTTIGATIAYAYASADAFKTARKENNRTVMVTGVLGLIAAFSFAVEFLVPNILGVTTLSTESYLILSIWGILGLVFFLILLLHDRERRLGRSTIAWIVLLALIIFTSQVWAYQSTVKAIGNNLGEAGLSSVITNSAFRSDVGANSVIQIIIIVVSLIILFSIYTIMQKRERQIEIEKVLAEESSRAKSSFLSNMSHEIRTPMNAIIGLDNIALKDQTLSPRTREQLEKIGSSARHLLGLINDILDMSRIESGRMVLKDEEFSFREFLDQINIMINGQCMDKGLHFECEIIGEVADYYVGDDMKLKQVLINILGNSVKFTNPPGEVTFTVEQTASFEGQCTLRFTMKDTGIGMDKEYIPKIFEAFSQEDATSTNRYGGSGLGMAITKNFVEMMNGEIHVESEKGVGSTFIVTVTLKASARRRMAEGNELPENLKAIVIDDDPVACEHAQIVLRAVGVECDLCENGKEALRRIADERNAGTPYDIVLTDYKMPEMTGIELTGSIREFDNNETVIIMLTGYNWDAIEEECFAAGVDGILAKPLFSDVIARELGIILYRKRGVHQEVQPSSASDASSESSKSDVQPEKDVPVLELAGRKVLMAEDIELNAEILIDLLEIEGIEADHAHNGLECIDMFASKPEGYYDAILMDVRMPVMDGLTATKGIRALEHPDAQTVPIIAMTANAFDEDVQRSLQAGMNAHLSKPVEMDRLIETLSKLLK